MQFRRQVAAQSRRIQQGLPNALHVVAQNRIVNVVRITVDFAGNPVAQAAFGTASNFTTVPQGGQLDIVRPAQRSGRGIKRLGL